MANQLTTLFTGRQKIHLREVPSTNSYLSEMQRSERLTEGAAVVAEFQTHGRGQAGNQWQSDRGQNLLVTFVFYPTFLNIQNVFLLNMGVAVALADFATEYLGEGVKLKWPNDLYYENRKLGGVLIENSIYDYQIRQAIIGIGVNVNQEIFSNELLNPASFKNITSINYDLMDVFNRLCNALEHRYLQLRRGEFQQLREDYHKHLLRHGKWEWFETDSRKFKGMVMGVNAQGRLMVQNEEGHTEHFDMKAIKYIFG